MKKNGKNPSGSQRWYCPDCRYSTTTKHDRQTKEKQFRQFLAYVTDTPDGPAEIDKAINSQQPWEDSLHVRKGWAGR